MKRWNAYAHPCSNSTEFYWLNTFYVRRMRIHCIGAHSLVAYSSLFLYANSASSCPGQKCYRNPFRILHRFSPLLAHRECPVPNTRARLATGDDANVRCPFEGVYSIASLFIEIKIKGTGDKFLCIIFVYRITKKKVKAALKVRGDKDRFLISK